MSPRGRGWDAELAGVPGLRARSCQARLVPRAWGHCSRTREFPLAAAGLGDAWGEHKDPSCPPPAHQHPNCPGSRHSPSTTAWPELSLGQQEEGMWSSARGHQAEDKQVPQLSQTLPGLADPRRPDPAQHPAAVPSTIPTRPGSSSTPCCHVRCCGFQQCLQMPIPSLAPQHGGALGSTATPSPCQPHGCWGQSGEQEEEEEGCSCPRLSRGPTAGLDARITRLQLDPGQPQPCHRSPLCPPPPVPVPSCSAR